MLQVEVEGDQGSRRCNGRNHHFRAHDVGLSWTTDDGRDPPGQRGRRTFGRKDKPFYISGLCENPRAVIHTLEATASAGIYDYLAHV